jgi:(R,R)-butanediol dehydrogenase/meso-butanediol dehydrogenase/diacetyl reductase
MEVRDVPQPEPGPGEVVLAVGYCGICGSDLHEYISPPGTPSPRAIGMWQPIMGHEFSGVVASVGAGVDTLKEGQPVAVHPGAPCGQCTYCKSGNAQLCSAPSGTGYGQPGAYAEYVAVRASQAVPLPDASWLDRAALSEPLGVALHALNRGALQAGESVFIAGGGPIGMLALLGARHMRAGTTILSEPAEARRELATSLGANHVLAPEQSDSATQVSERMGPDLLLAQGSSAARRARELTDGLGVDIAVEAVGIAPAMDDCRAATRRGGRIVVAGAFDTPYRLDLLMTLLQEHSIIGSFGYKDELPIATGLIVSGKIDVAPVISRVVEIDDVPEAFAELTADRNSGEKVLVRGAGAK